MKKGFARIGLLLLFILTGEAAFSSPSAPFYLQAGSFKSITNAQNYQRQLSGEVSYPVIIEKRGIYNAVRIGPIPTLAEAKALNATLFDTIPVKTQRKIPVSNMPVAKKNTNVTPVHVNVGAMDKDAALLPKSNLYPWSVTGSGGYTVFQQAGDGSGGALVGRFALGKELFASTDTRAGLEVGVQSGNRMSIGASQATLDEMGSLPIWTTVKPMVDVLATLRMAPWENKPAFLVFKGGIAYRQWETERQSINNLSQVAGEVQAGLGMSIIEKAMVSLLYQGVYGSSPNFTVNPDSSGTVSHIPVQNGVLLSLSLYL